MFYLKQGSANSLPCSAREPQSEIAKTEPLFALHLVQPDFVIPEFTTSGKLAVGWIMV